jgi:O-antigen/teichoic acid export membrane protein
MEPLMAATGTDNRRRIAELPPQAEGDGHLLPEGPSGRLAQKVLVNFLLGATARKGFLALFDQAVVSGTTFATSVLIGRLGSQHELGVYYLALTVVLLVQGLQERAVSTPYTVYCNRCRDQRLASYTGSALLLQFALSATSVLALAVILGLLTLGLGPGELAGAVWVLLGALPLMLLREFLRSLAIAHLRLGRAVALDAVVSALQIGGLLLLAVLGLLSAATAYAAIGAACGVACLGWALQRADWKKVWKKLSGTSRPEDPAGAPHRSCLTPSSSSLSLDRSRVIGDWRQNWSFAKWVIASNLVGESGRYALPWVLAMVHGAAATGLLAASLTLVGVANVFVAGLSKFVTAKAARAYADGGSRSLRRVLAGAAVVMAVVLGGFCLLFLVAGSWLAETVFGPEYAGCGTVTAVLACGVLVTSLGNTVGQGLWAMDRPRANFLPDLSASAVTVYVLVWLVSSHGVLGAAVAILAGAVVGALLRYRALERILNKHRY